MRFFVYLLHCSNGSYYVGHTDNVDRRVGEHNAGKGAEYTRKYRPVKLVYQEALGSEIEAMMREGQIKRWSKAKKDALVDGNLMRLKLLSKRRVK